MDNIHKFVSEAIADFRQVAALADPEVNTDSITVEIASRPHLSPKELPIGKMAVYAFFLNGQALKVGKVGHKSKARYTSQHYNPSSARSNLSRSILADPAKAGVTGVNERNIGSWVKQHTDRVNLLVPASLGDAMLSLLESFLHVRWKPKYEGRSNYN